MTFTSAILQAGALGVLAIILLLVSRRRYNLPPGPPGNVAGEFRNTPMPEVFEKWRQKYGTWNGFPATPITNPIMGKPTRSDILLQAGNKTCHRCTEQILSALLTESYLTTSPKSLTTSMPPLLYSTRGEISIQADQDSLWRMMQMLCLSRTAI